MKHSTAVDKDTSDFLTDRCTNIVDTICPAAARPTVHPYPPTRAQPSLAHCASRGAWKRQARWTRQTWCARSAASLTPTTATTNSVNGSCCCVSMATRALTHSSSGRWKSVSCRDSHSMVYDSSASLARPLVLRILHQRSPMSFTYESVGICCLSNS